MDNKKTLKGCGIGCFGLIVVIAILTFVLVSCTVDGEEEEKAFDFTVDEYEAALRKTVSENSAGTYLKMGERSEIEKNRYGFLLAEGIYAFVTTNDKGQVVDISMSVTGNAFLVSNKEMLIAYQSIVKSVDPTISVTQSTVLFDELGITGDSRMLDHESYYELNGIGYEFAGSIEEDVLVLLVKPE